uniref:Uncharacterized protein n=1 Tax=Timema douglasi TaxID=61478 RepID=A0A7R8VMA8_TIMDO|nr:unnamed protein product [Timema douglasi]
MVRTTMARPALWLLLVLVACARVCRGIPKELLYPHGPGIDTNLPRDQDEAASPEITLLVPIVFYGETYNAIYSFFLPEFQCQGRKRSPVENNSIHAPNKTMEFQTVITFLIHRLWADSLGPPMESPTCHPPPFATVYTEVSGRAFREETVAGCLCGTLGLLRRPTPDETRATTPCYQRETAIRVLLTNKTCLLLMTSLRYSLFNTRPDLPFVVLSGVGHDEQISTTNKRCVTLRYVNVNLIVIPALTPPT